MWCNKCKQDLDNAAFTPTMQKETRDGSRWCNACKRKNRDYAKEYQKVLPKRQANEADKQARRDYAKQRRQLAPEQKRYSESLRRARKKQAMPPWVTEEMKQQIKDFYKNCPEGYEVDHIHPLAGKTFCGLHVPWNLQYLPTADNRKKYNKLILAQI